MPNLEPEDIKQLIANNQIAAIAIDTEVFDANQLNFQNKKLQSLTQFIDRPIDVLLPMIVFEEIVQHLAIKKKETQSRLKNAIRKYQIGWLGGDTVIHDIDFDIDPTDAARSELNQFIEHIKASVIDIPREPTLGIDIVNRYLTLKPPFENKADKKCEFPDCFALLSLEAYAKEINKHILCVSADNGWHLFAAQSETIVACKELPEALSYFNEVDIAVTDRLVEKLRSDDPGDLGIHIVSAMDHSIGDHGFEALADSYFDEMEYENEPVETLNVKYDSVASPKVILSDGENVIISFYVKADVLFKSNFSFYKYDKSENDYIDLGGMSAEEEREVEFEVVATISIEDSEMEPISVDVQTDSSGISVDFGFLDPYADEDPTHEKY